jgi:hypothetical protein
MRVELAEAGADRAALTALCRQWLGFDPFAGLPLTELADELETAIEEVHHGMHRCAA